MKKTTVQFVENRIEETIKKQGLIDRGDKLVLGLSGGPDSRCLFEALYRLSARLGFTIQPVHINHMMRPGAADRDQEYVEEVCRSKGLTCRSFRIDCPALARELGMTGEEAGRMARYRAFYDTAVSLRETAGASGAVKIAVAQNANDQAETVLFRIIRGTGTDGLAGIAYSRLETGRDGDVEVIRPLLDVFREDIEDYCRALDLEPVRDHTNEEAVYTRNKIRLELLPLLRDRYNENMTMALVRLAGIAASDKEFIWEQVEDRYARTLIEEGEDLVILDRELLAGQPDAIRHRLVIRAFGRTGLDSDISAERLEAADRVIRVKQAPKTVEFPRGYRLTVARGRVLIGRGPG